MIKTLFILFVTMQCFCFAELQDPQIILKKVLKAYQSMETFETKGTVTTDLNTANIEEKKQMNFSIRLKKPNLYRIIWGSNNTALDDLGISNGGAVWNDGTQAFLYVKSLKKLVKMQDDASAIAGATGVSQGVAMTIPSLFLSIFQAQQADPFSRLTQAKLEGMQHIEGQSCYVISSPSIASKKETYWVSTSNFMILKYTRSLEPPKGGYAIPKLSDEDIKTAIKQMGHEVTKEKVESMRKMMEQASASLDIVQLKGESIEMYTEISNPKFKAKDFTFNTPKGVTVSNSL
jgi:outer membrane lipoprotein-sorting protein